jgi:hypothetical protein
VSRSGLLPAAGLASAAALAYLNAFRGAYQFDDYTVIVQNPAVASVSAWAASMPGIRPLLKLSYALNHGAGLGLLGFHAFNLLCHVATALLAMRVCRRLAASSARLAPLAGPIGLTAGLIFALHPAQTEAVTYLSGRSMSLMGGLYLGAIVAHQTAGGGLSARLVSPLLFALALATKETGVTLPAALVLLDRAEGAPWSRALRRTLPHWAVLAAALLAGLALPGYQRLLGFSLAIRSVADNLLTQVGGVSYLLAQPLLGLRTSMDPPLGPETALTPGLAVRGALLLAVLAAGVALFRRRPPVGAAVLWLFLHLAPTNSLLPRLDVANDRQLYLAILGPAFLAAAGAWRWLPRQGAMVAACVVALLLGTATIRRNEDYRSERALWAATVATSPQSPRAWNNLGYAHQLAGELEPAAAAYERALALDPSAFRARWNLEAVKDMRNAGCGMRNEERSAEGRVPGAGTNGVKRPFGFEP